jgi:hypothetical protein
VIRQVDASGLATLRIPAGVNSRGMCARTMGLAVANGILVAMGAPPTAAAQTQVPTIDVHWAAPPVCPPRDAVLAEVRRLLGPLGGGGESVVARADVTQASSGRWSASLRIGMEGAESRRDFEAETCSALASAVALIVAIASDARAAATVAAAPSEAREGLPAALSPALRPIAAATRAEDRGQLELTLGAALDAKLLPNASPGGALGIGWSLRRSWWRVWALAGAAVFAQETAHVATGESGTLALVASSARACVTFVAAPFEAGPCAGVEVDYMWATAATGDPSFTFRQAHQAWATLAGAVLAAVRLAPSLAIFGQLDGLVPLEQPRFDVRKGEQTVEVHRVPAEAARAILGLEARFF